MKSIFIIVEKYEYQYDWIGYENEILYGTVPCTVQYTVLRILFQNAVHLVEEKPPSRFIRGKICTLVVRLFVTTLQFTVQYFPSDYIQDVGNSIRWYWSTCRGHFLLQISDPLLFSLKV